MSSNFKFELQRLEDDLSSAQDNFRTFLLNSTSTFNFLAKEFRDITTNSTQVKLEVFGKDFNEKLKSESHIQSDCLVGTIQAKLRESVQKSNRTIKRSLLQCSNFVAQFNLFNLPYYELRAYKDQIFELDDKQMYEHFQPNGVSYEKAIQELKEIYNDAHWMEKEILCFLKRYDNEVIDNKFDNSGCEDEYKQLPPITTY
ncbi:hypothetical protein ABEB36_005953 [Hypothenemus hampei]|uniref:Uncharacterized protein n=1 Tax=Hypothenemus hampei TaxID=57062 RepID=A0ABD1EZZ9_HYPHA